MDDEERMYVPNNENGENVIPQYENDDNEEEIVNEPLHAIEQREVLADYFMSAEGALQ